MRAGSPPSGTAQPADPLTRSGAEEENLARAETDGVWHRASDRPEALQTLVVQLARLLVSPRSAECSPPAWLVGRGRSLRGDRAHRRCRSTRSAASFRRARLSAPRASSCT
eukprot:2869335-Prymnesium_polylepis.1